MQRFLKMVQFYQILLPWIFSTLTTVAMETSDGNSNIGTSLFGQKNGRDLTRGCPPPVKEFDHQGRRRYEGAELWRITPSSMPEVAMLNLMLIGSEGKTMIFSEEPHSINRTVEVMFKKIVKKSGPKMLHERGIASERIYEDVQEYLDSEWKRLNPLKKGYHENEFNTYDMIVEHLVNLTTKCSHTFHCSLKSIGKTVEDRNIFIFKIVPLTDTRRPVVWLDATRSAHNWLAAASVVELIEMLVEGSHGSPEIRESLGSLEWVFNPVANPDGYEFSWKKDRFFGKNRSPTSEPDCPGVDLDRNFDYKISDNSYTRLSECFDFYNGRKQEAETAAILEEMAALKGTLLGWINVKQGPWRVTLPQGLCKNDKDDKMAVTKQLLKAKNLQKPWTLDENCRSVYKPAGQAMDYIHNAFLAKFTLTLEIGGSTFDVTSGDIPESTKELREFLLALTKRIADTVEETKLVHDEM